MLKWIGITHAGLAGDTRFDRVVELPKKHQEILPVKQFVGNQQVLVAGSTWPADEALLKQLATQYPLWKFILAPHEVNQNHIDDLLSRFPQAIKFSEFSSYNHAQIDTAQILLIDNIGMLSSLYFYGDIAYIGGGFGAGIHNTLEAATYGIPVIFGPKYGKFQEAVDLVTLMAAFSVTNYNELQGIFLSFQEQERRQLYGEAAGAYVKQRAGATQIIMKYLETERLLD